VPAELTGAVRRIRLDESLGEQRLSDWLVPLGTRPLPVAIDPAWAFNIIYSSGTTGTPKGIVQSHAMRWGQVRRAAAAGYDSDCVTLIATPLYSNTTLVVVNPDLGARRRAGALPQVRLRAVPRRWPHSTAPRTRCWCRCIPSA